MLNSKSRERPDITKDPIVSTFLAYVIPSVLSLLAISTASIVDGIYIGNYSGHEALSIINLLIPFTSFAFGLAFMLAIGGSVKASYYLGSNNSKKASAIFSQTLIATLILSTTLVGIANVFDTQVFRFLGATDEMHAIMRPYFNVLSLFLVVQHASVIFYYFIRTDARPKLGTIALVSGSILNILLDWVFIAVMDYELQGAVWATLVSQLFQFSLLSLYFIDKERKLTLSFPSGNWADLVKTTSNGFSEFINEISAGIVIFVLNWIIIRDIGVEGLAAYSIIKYIIFISLMIYCGIVDAMHILFSRNFGAQEYQRVNRFLKTAALTVSFFSLSIVIALHFFSKEIVGLFLNDSAEFSKELAISFIESIWPLFLINGFNVLISAYLTSAQKSVPSASISLLRGLILPVSISLLLYNLTPNISFIFAFPLAEGITFFLALFLLMKFRPSKIQQLNQSGTR